MISSGMMGTISGSGVANVLTVGQFTIPLMKRFGYSPVFAGAVEATSSMGGQIMPPVMGAVAFIMAETLNVPYVTIVKAAVIPAVLYYATAFWMVHLEAGRRGHLHGLPKAHCPNPWMASAKWYLMLPLAVLVYMLFDGFTPMFSGIVGLALTGGADPGRGIAAAFGPKAFRYVFWIVAGLLLGGYLRYGFDRYGVIADPRRHRGAGRGRALPEGWSDNAGDHARQPGGRRAPGHRGGYRVRDRRGDHRRADTDRCGVELRRIRAGDRQSQHVPVARSSR